MDEGSVSWIELPGGPDCAATGRFYAAVFGWAVETSNGTTWFREPGGPLAGAFLGSLAASPARQEPAGDADPADNAPSLVGPLLYLATRDAAAALGRVQAAGGRIVLGRTEIAPGVGHRALFRDPAGTTMGLFERPRDS